MSQNQTVFPGIGPDDGDYKDNRQYQSGNYSRSRESNGTVFPGMENTNREAGMGNNGVYSRQPNKPLVGFLYSISRTGFGEYWPIYIGPNVIGRSGRCDIVLPEGTVSQEHAVIVVRMMKNPQKLDVSISDERSSHGTMVNGESISSSRPLECKNGDIITVGESYQLYLIIVDSKSLGLNIAENFIDVSGPDDDYNYGDRRYDDRRYDDRRYDDRRREQPRTRIEEDYPPRFVRKDQFGNDEPEYKGTVGMDGNATGGPRRGGTVGMGDNQSSGPRRGGTEWQ